MSSSVVGELLVAFGIKPDSSWGNAEKLITRISNAAKAFLVGQAAGAVMRLVESTTEVATHLFSASQAMGLTVTQTQELGYVAQQSGSSMEKLGIGMSFLIGNLRKFAAGGGSKQFKRDMAEIGISQQQAADALKSPDGMMGTLLKISDHIHAVGKNGNSAGLGRELFSARAGRDMVADFERGSKAIKELMERRRAMGELDENQVATLRELGNHIKDVKNSFSALAQGVIAQLAPTLLELADSAIKWIAANKDLITGVITAAVKGLALAFGALFKVVSAVSDLIHAAMDGDTGAQALIIGIAAAIATILVPALWAMAAPIIAATLPLLAITLVVAAIAFGILMLVKHWDAVKDAAQATWDAIKKAATDAWDWIKTTASDAWDWIKSEADDLWTSLKDGLSSAFETVRNLPIIQQLIDLVEKLDAITGVGRSIGGAIFDATHDDGLDHSDEGDSPEAVAIRAARYNGQYYHGASGAITGAGSSVPPPPPNGAASQTVAGAVMGDVHVAPTTINIYGVDGATAATNKMGEAIDMRNRHTRDALVKGVQ